MQLEADGQAIPEVEKPFCWTAHDPDPPVNSVLGSDLTSHALLAATVLTDEMISATSTPTTITSRNNGRSHFMEARHSIAFTEASR
jgi:hypothetical protein